MEANEFSLLELRAALRGAVRAPAPEASADVLRLLAVAPSLPAEVAARGLRVGGEDAQQALDRLVEEGWAEAAEAALPWSGKMYRMSGRQRRRALRWLEGRPQVSDKPGPDPIRTAHDLFLNAEATIGKSYPPAIARWLSLLEMPVWSWGLTPPHVIAQRLDEAVEKALAEARQIELASSPEATTLLDAAEPLAVYLGGAVRVAWARAQRALELHHRRSSDFQQLNNYLERPELDEALKRLAGQDKYWALHYLGLGGTGKTMFLRHVDARLARELRLATGRVDFDHLNPNYPLRSPGLLLIGFAEQLRLDAPEAAVESFRKLSVLVGDVHHELDEAQRSGREVPLGFSAPGFDLAVESFVTALEHIHRAGRRPVLILDTCEELARVNPDRHLPRTVVETFRILEDLHDRCPPLRVVFSGRRALAREGAGWRWRREELPERKYLMLYPIVGFTRGEALKMLEAYGRRDTPPRSVPAARYERILDLSAEAPVEEMAKLEPVSDDDAIPVATIARETRHNPYDVALFARWASDPKSDFGTEELSGSKRHYYVRERIVSRVREDVGRRLPMLAVLERFDEELVGEVADAGDEFPSLWAEIRRQEFVDVDRGTAGEQEDAPVLFWNLDSRMRRRLEDYYLEELPEAWRNARERAGEVLERVTLEREWSALTPSYFAVCVHLLADRPEAAAEWWEKVERRILEDDAWDWADKITSAVLAAEAPKLRTEEATHPLTAPIHALRANVLIRQMAEDEELGDVWRVVIATAAAYPDAAGRELLSFRGSAGLIGHWRYRSELPSEEDLLRIDDSIRDLPLSERSWAGVGNQRLREQASLTKSALVENCVEIMERLAFKQKYSFRKLHIHVGQASAYPFDTVSRARFGLLLRQRYREGWATWAERPSADEPRGFDWVPPADKFARQLLEWGRIFEKEGIDRAQLLEYCVLAHQHVGAAPRNLDQDRLLSQAVRLGGTEQTGHEALLLLATTSIALGTAREECQAHRKTPPLYCSAIQAVAGEGQVDAALNALEEARAFQPPKLVLTRLDAVSAYLNRRFRLAEPEDGTAEAAELPANARNDVARFLSVCEAALAKVKEGAVDAGDGRRAREAAERLGIGIPTKASELQTVPRGWQPWFARYLLVQNASATPRDKAEREAIRAALAALYRSGRPPEDIGFELTPAKKRRWLEITAAVAILGLLAYAGYRGVKWGGSAVSSKLGMTWWEAMLAYFGVAGTLLAAWRLIGNLGKFFELEYWIRRSTEGIRFGSRVRMFGRLGGDAVGRLVEPVNGSGPYRLASEKLLEEPWRGCWTVQSVFARLIRIRTTFAIESGQESGLCWEAMIGMAGGRLPTFESPYAFRRTGPVSQRFGDPFAGPMSAITVSSTRRLRFAPQIANCHSRHFDALPDYPMEDAGLLVFQTEVGFVNETIRFVSGAGVYTTPNELTRLFSNLRLCVLMDLDRSEATVRTSIDRISAGRVRMAAHELFLFGISAVITIPYLPVSTDLSDEVLEILAEAAAKRPGNASEDLRKAVRTIQDRIYKTSSLAREDAAELAYDVCFYSADVVNLAADFHADPSETLPAARKS